MPQRPAHPYDHNLSYTAALVCETIGKTKK